MTVSSSNSRSGNTKLLPKQLDNLSAFERLLVDYRWLFVLVFLIPLSLLFNLYLHVRQAIVHYLMSAPHRHAEKVARIRDEV